MSKEETAGHTLTRKQLQSVIDVMAAGELTEEETEVASLLDAIQGDAQSLTVTITVPQADTTD